MADFSRRKLLQGLLAGGAVTALSPLIPGFRSRPAYAHASTDAFPTIFIMMAGGLDAVMHWDAKAGLPLRNVQAADIRETASGIRWYQPLLDPLASHMEDMTLIRNIRCTGSHGSGTGALWFGETDADVARDSTPWAHYLSSALLDRRTAVAPTLATYETYNQDIVELADLSSNSPNPAALTQRLQDLTAFANALDVFDSALPGLETQERVYALTKLMDQRHYSKTVQKKTINQFTAANVQASELLTEPQLKLWPPLENTQDLFNLSESDINDVGYQNNQSFSAHIAFAYEAARLRSSYVVYVQSVEDHWDTHEANDSQQRVVSGQYMPTIGRLLSALKSTPSPIDPSLSMYDTTHVVLTSEMARSTVADTGEGLSGDGTIHGNFTQAALFGGNFKRATTFGATDDDDLTAIPANLTTGALNEGVNPSVKSLLATIIKANGVDPSAWTSEPPIDAVLN